MKLNSVAAEAKRKKKVSVYNEGDKAYVWMYLEPVRNSKTLVHVGWSFVILKNGILQEKAAAVWSDNLFCDDISIIWE